MTRIDEPDSTGSLGTVAAPTQPTSYVYDVLDDLTTVTQGTQPSRSFVYDSLKRLTDATNPESGHVHYTYDANSNLATKLDARSITTTYVYDALNRVTKRTYSDSTPEVDYYYDNQTLPANKPPNFTPAYSTGRLIAVCYGGATSSAGSYQSYDQLGRVTSSYQQTDSQNYGFGYGYNLASEMTSEVYPSGRTITNAYDTAGRLSSVNGQKTGESNKLYASSIGYAAQGAVNSMTLGNNLIENTSFNTRLQPTFIKLGTASNPTTVVQLGYTYGVLVGGSLDTAMNNGNVESQTVTVSTSAIKQSYLYDTLNRLQSAAESFNQTPKWTQSYGFDRYGNRTSLANSGTDGGLLPTSSTPSVDAATNRINQSGFTYDPAGNLKQEPSKSYDYDAENRQVKFNNGAATYSYDGDGHRVKKVVAGSPNVTTVFVYNVQGQLIAEYTDGSSSGSGTSYLTTDHLGSTRVVTNSSGNVVGRHDYLPYGEEIPSQVGGRSGVGNYFAADGVRQKFTQKERDNESGLDYFLARYYSSAQGRFTGVDPYNPIVDSENKKEFKTYLEQPQNWNRYVYVWNNPLKYIDPNGERIYVVTFTTGNKEGDEEFKRVAETLAAQIKNSEGYDTKKDTVILRGVKTKEDFEGVVMGANQQEKEYGKIEQVALVSHAGPDHGPIFEYGTPRQDQYFNPKAELPKLWFNWSQTAEAKFLGCNTAVKFAQNFADAQRVPAWGFNTFSSISSRPDKKAKGYWLNPWYKGPLYMVGNDGRAMVRRRPTP